MTPKSAWVVCVELEALVVSGTWYLYCWVLVQVSVWKKKKVVLYWTYLQTRCAFCPPEGEGEDEEDEDGEDDDIDEEDEDEEDEEEVEGEEDDEEVSGDDEVTAKIHRGAKMMMTIIKFDANSSGGGGEMLPDRRKTTDWMGKSMMKRKMRRKMRTVWNIRLRRCALF